MNLKEALEYAHYAEELDGYDSVTLHTTRQRKAAQLLGNALRNRGFASVSAMEQELRERLLIPDAPIEQNAANATFKFGPQ